MSNKKKGNATNPVVLTIWKKKNTNNNI